MPLAQRDWIEKILSIAADASLSTASSRSIDVKGMRPAHVRVRRHVAGEHVGLEIELVGGDDFVDLDSRQFTDLNQARVARRKVRRDNQR